MTANANFDPAKTALLSLDVQRGVLDFVPAAQSMLAPAARAMEAARKNQFLILHAGLGFEPGYPEVGPRASRFALVKERGLFLKGSESSAFHPAIAKPGETIIYKQRYSAFFRRIRCA